MATLIEFIIVLGIFAGTIGLGIGFFLFSGIRRRIYILIKSAKEYPIDVLFEDFKNGEIIHSWDFAKPVVSASGFWRYQLLLSKEKDGKTGLTIELKEEPTFSMINGRRFMVVFRDAEGALRHATDHSIVHVQQVVYVDNNAFCKDLNEYNDKMKVWNALPEEEKTRTAQPIPPAPKDYMSSAENRVIGLEHVMEVSTHSEAKAFLGESINDFANPRSPRYQNRLRDILSNPTLWALIICGLTIIGTVLASQYSYRKNLEAQSANMQQMAPILAQSAAQAVMQVMTGNSTHIAPAGAPNLNQAPPDAGLGGLLNINKVGG